MTTRGFVYRFLCFESFRYCVCLRLSHYLRDKKRTNPLFFIPYVLSYLVLRHLTFKYGILIPVGTSIGPGLYVGHFGGIVVSEKAVIGRNCNIGPGVCIGKASRGTRLGYPVIGDEVYMGPGAKIFGAVKIGSRVAIGANCVVTSDIPDNAVVVGVPGRVVSLKGVEGYIKNTDYELQR